MSINVIKAIENFKNTNRINPHYDLTMGGLSQLYQNSEGIYDMACNSFIFGYIQGLKAAKSEAKSL